MPLHKIKYSKGTTDYLIKIWQDKKRNISYGYVSSYFDCDWSEPVIDRDYYQVLRTLKKWVDNRFGGWDMYIKNNEIEKLKRQVSQLESKLVEKEKFYEYY